MATNKSSRRWLKEHFTDPYVKKAQQEGYRSRAVYKLLELQERDHLFKPGMIVIDLGAAPGGWSQLVTKLIQPRGEMIALDILPMEPIPGVQFIEADFSKESTVSLLEAKLGGAKVDWVLSDMAPNMSGNESVDIPRAMLLAELAVEFACQVLKPQGGFLTKLFQGEGFDALLTSIRQTFVEVRLRKPKASRSRSREIYLVARGLKSKRAGV